MSTVEGSPTIWSNITKENSLSKYEKCRNITEEIYKRINITFQIKKLETGAQSDVSDNSSFIDSNSLSNETDLFACDRSDSLVSSAEGTRPEGREGAGLVVAVRTQGVARRTKKRFRKRVKKRPQTLRRCDSEGSSDEALPLSKMADDRRPAAITQIDMLTKDLKPKILVPPEKRDKKITKNTEADINSNKKPEPKTIEKTESQKKESAILLKKKEKSALFECGTCNISFVVERDLSRHVKSHREPEKSTTKSKNV